MNPLIFIIPIMLVLVPATLVLHSTFTIEVLAFNTLPKKNPAWKRAEWRIKSQDLAIATVSWNRNKAKIHASAPIAAEAQRNLPYETGEWLADLIGYRVNWLTSLRGGTSIVVVVRRDSPLIAK